MPGQEPEPVPERGQPSLARGTVGLVERGAPDVASQMGLVHLEWSLLS